MYFPGMYLGAAWTTPATPTVTITSIKRQKFFILLHISGLTIWFPATLKRQGREKFHTLTRVQPEFSIFLRGWTHDSSHERQTWYGVPASAGQGIALHRVYGTWVKHAHRRPS